MADKAGKKAAVTSQGLPKATQQRTRGPDKKPRKKKTTTKAKK